MNRITMNFLVVSNYNNDISWVSLYTSNYLIYDQSNTASHFSEIDQSKVIPAPHMGHNIRDYCTYIIEHYDDLPDVVILAAGNVFPRHSSENYFASVMNARIFTPIEEPGRHAAQWPMTFLDKEGGYNEYNDGWYLKYMKSNYFHSYNELAAFCFKDTTSPLYIRFTPGANYIVPRECILKYPKVFYENLRLFVSRTLDIVPTESYLIERMFYTLWTRAPEANPKMLQKLPNDFSLPESYKEPISLKKIAISTTIKVLLVWKKIQRAIF